MSVGPPVLSALVSVANFKCRPSQVFFLSFNRPQLKPRSFPLYLALGLWRVAYLHRITTTERLVTTRPTGSKDHLESHIENLITTCPDTWFSCESLWQYPFQGCSSSILTNHQCKVESLSVEDHAAWLLI